jgi:hypothetical protein
LRFANDSEFVSAAQDMHAQAVFHIGKVAVEFTA